MTAASFQREHLLFLCYKKMPPENFVLLEASSRLFKTFREYFGKTKLARKRVTIEDDSHRSQVWPLAVSIFCVCNGRAVFARALCGVHGPSSTDLACDVWLFRQFSSERRYRLPPV